MSWTIRPAASDDLAGIMEIETSVFASTAWSEQMMLSELQNKNCAYFVAVPKTRGSFGILGYAGLLCPLSVADADVQTLAVSPNMRRSGVGRELMNTLLAEAGLRGAKQVFLEVRSDNLPAQQLYAALGYEQIAVRRGYYQPEGVDAWVMKRPIFGVETGEVGENG